MITREVITYVEFLSPGAFLAEIDTKVVKDFRPLTMAVPDNAYAFRSYRRVKISTTVEGETFTKYETIGDKTGYYYPGGQRMSLADIAAVFGEDSILYQNIKGNDYQYAVKHRHGGFYWFDPEKDVILP